MELNVRIEALLARSRGFLSKITVMTDKERSALIVGQIDIASVASGAPSAALAEHLCRKAASIEEQQNLMPSSQGLACPVEKRRREQASLSHRLFIAHVDDAIGAIDVTLSAEDIQYLEELYVPHKVVGAL